MDLFANQATQGPAKEGERFIKAGGLTEVYHPAPKLGLT
jgi:hypothetical protein